MISDYADSNGCFDRDVYDYFTGLGVAWVFDAEVDRDDPCDITINLMASSIPVTRVFKHSMNANIAGFVGTNYRAIKTFTEEYSTDVLSDRRDEEDIYNGVRCINGLVSGYYSKEAYWRFLNLLGGRRWPGSYNQ